jgi:hypothetical protein
MTLLMSGRSSAVPRATLLGSVNVICTLGQWSRERHCLTMVGVNLRQGSQMASQLELSARAALCKQLAKREPENRALWMAEAENWSRLSNEKLRGEPEQKPVTASWPISA